MLGKKRQAQRERGEDSISQKGTCERRGKCVVFLCVTAVILAAQVTRLP